MDGLERSVKRWRVASCGLALAALGGFIAAAAPKAQDEDLEDLFCKSLSVVNDDGKPVVMLYADGGGGSIGIRNAAQEAAFIVGAGEKETALTLNPAGKGGGVSLMAGSTSGVISLRGANGKNAAMIFSEKSAGRVALYDGRKKIWAAPE